MSDAASFDAQLDRLDRNLEEIGALLRRYNAEPWATWATRCRTQLAIGDATGFDWILMAFGGMGSLNDLVIVALNGYDIRPVDVSPVNDRISALKTAIYMDATALRHEVR